LRLRGILAVGTIADQRAEAAAGDFRRYRPVQDLRADGDFFVQLT
jgi:hypothetical protein